MSVAWRPDAAKANGNKSEGDGAVKPQLSLLTASADRSLIHWTPVSDPGRTSGPESRVWMASESVGDAASGCLGFYGAMFDARARRVLAHAHGGRAHAGAARLKSRGRRRRWAPAPASAGHAGEVTSLSWDAAGRFLLSGSVDMTARAHASWESRVDETFLSDLRDVHKPVTLTLDAPTTGWREIARPQIHGHAVTCVAALPGGVGAEARRRRKGGCENRRRDPRRGVRGFRQRRGRKDPARLRRARDVFRDARAQSAALGPRGAQGAGSGTRKSGGRLGRRRAPAARALQQGSEGAGSAVGARSGNALGRARRARRARRRFWSGRRRRRGGFSFVVQLRLVRGRARVWGGPGPHEQPAPARERAHQVARAQTPRRRHRGRAPPGRDHADARATQRGRTTCGCGCAPRGRRHDSGGEGAERRRERRGSLVGRAAPTGFVLRPGGDAEAAEAERGLGREGRRRAGGGGRAATRTRTARARATATPSAASRRRSCRAPRRRRPWRRRRCGRRRASCTGTATTCRAWRRTLPARWWRPRARRARRPRPRSGSGTQVRTGARWASSPARR